MLARKGERWGEGRERESGGQVANGDFHPLTIMS